MGDRYRRSFLTLKIPTKLRRILMRRREPRQGIEGALCAWAPGGIRLQRTVVMFVSFGHTLRLPEADLEARSLLGMYRRVGAREGALAGRAVCSYN